jgi:hypothetical protein
MLVPRNQNALPKLSLRKQCGNLTCELTLDSDCTMDTCGQTGSGNSRGILQGLDEHRTLRRGAILWHDQLAEILSMKVWYLPREIWPCRKICRVQSCLKQASSKQVSPGCRRACQPARFTHWHDKAITYASSQRQHHAQPTQQLHDQSSSSSTSQFHLSLYSVRHAARVHTYNMTRLMKFLLQVHVSR